MNKTQLIETLSQKTSLSFSKCENLLSSLEKLIFDALKKGEEVRLTKLGRFYVKSLPARELKNPKTGRRFFLGECKLVAFKISQKLKKSII